MECSLNVRITKKKQGTFRTLAKYNCIISWDDVWSKIILGYNVGLLGDCIFSQHAFVYCTVN